MATSLVTLSQWHAEACAARHALRTGAQVASGSYRGRAVSYTAAKAAELDAYIADLENEMTAITTGKPKRMMYRIQQTGLGY